MKKAKLLLCELDVRYGYKLRKIDTEEIANCACSLLLYVAIIVLTFLNF